MLRDPAILLDIVLACRRILTFIDGIDRDGFLHDEKTQSAVLHQLLVIGEATKRLSDSFRATHAGVPWREIAGMRDRLVHHYDAVDLDEVWRTVIADLPGLLQELGPLVPEET